MDTVKKCAWCGTPYTWHRDENGHFLECPVAARRFDAFHAAAPNDKKNTK